MSLLTDDEDITLDGTRIPQGCYHGHEISRKSSRGKSWKVILEKHTTGNTLGVPVDITRLIGGKVMMNEQDRRHAS
jgi:hypothetical protein